MLQKESNSQLRRLLSPLNIFRLFSTCAARFGGGGSNFVAIV